MRITFRKTALLGSILATSLVVAGTGSARAPTSLTPAYVDQGPAWTAATRADFYTRDQGAQLIPLAWLKALTTAEGQPFLGDSLSRYGYLPADHHGSPYTRMTTGCDQRNSGNSHCGHEFGTTLSAEDKRALLEYLKIL
jgi:hypothetical protein